MTDNDSQALEGVPAAHAKTAPRSWMWLSVLLSSVLAVALFAGTAGAILYSDLAGKVSASALDTSALRKSNSSVPAEGSDDASEDNVSDSFAGRPVNILLMGIDARLGQDASIINEGDDDETMRSDTTLLVHMSADRQNVSVISIPRDMWIQLPECTRSDGSVSYQQWGQFNWAFSYGAQTDDMAGGVACTEATVEELTGVTLDGFAVIDFNGFARMVEALGGVEVCLEEPIEDWKYLGLQLPAGCQVLDPVIATQYARVRYVGDGSDMGRIQRQQGLLGSMVIQAMDSNLFTDLPSLYAFLSVTIEAMRLSPSLSNLNTAAGLAMSIRDIDHQNIRFLTMPVLTTDFDANRLMPKEPQNTELWQSVINDEPLPPGTVFMDIEGNYFTVDENGVPVPGGDPRTDDEIGIFTGEKYDPDSEY